jgi:hypothetical protein
MQLPSAILVWSLFYFVMVKAAEAVYSSFDYFKVPVNDYSVFNIESVDTYSNYKLTLILGRAPPLTR